MQASCSDARLAVVMITHNRLDSALRSIGELDRLPERPKIVLVDNESSDGTARAVAERFPGVTILHAGGNLGAAARTLGVRHVDAPYVAFCDDDTWWEPGSLRTAADLLDAHPRLALINGRVLVGPVNREDPNCVEMASSPLPREAGMPGPPILGFMAGASVVRRSAYLEAGGFEPRFFVGGEEEMLAADLAARDWWLCYVPELVSHHHPSSVRDSSGRRSTMARNALWFSWLRRPLPVALRKTMQLVRRSPWDRDTRQTLYESLRELPWILRSRRILPARVERDLRLLEAEA